MGEILDNEAEDHPNMSENEENISDIEAIGTDEDDSELDEDEVVEISDVEHSEEVVESCDVGDSDDDDSDDVNAVPSLLISPSGLVWSENSPNQGGRAPARNILRQRPGLKPGVRPNDSVECFRMFMTEALNEIVLHANRQGRCIVDSWNRLHPENRKMWTAVDYMEMEAFVGLHIIAGAYKSQFRSLEDL